LHPEGLHVLPKNEAHTVLEVTAKGPLVLLFFDGYDLRVLPGFFGKMRAQILQLLRFTKKTLLRQQVRTGYYTAFLSLVNGLKSIGCDVRVNDFAAAKKRPYYPIGIAGFPSVLKKVTLSNPKIFGPGDFGLPDACAGIIANPEFHYFTMPSTWACNLFRPTCGDKIWRWFAGIDTRTWQDISDHPKTYDFVIYDKISWHRDLEVPRVRDKIIVYLETKNLTYLVLRYGKHHHSEFLDALKKSRALLFLSAHETQGIAYQEALASNIPVLAWNEGKLVDPTLLAFVGPEFAASAVPYFDARCGKTFTIDAFEQTCDAFLEKLSTFQPRQFIQENLSLEIAGKRYLEQYKKVAARHSAR